MQQVTASNCHYLHLDFYKKNQATNPKPNTYPSPNPKVSTCCYLLFIITKYLNV